MKALLCVLLCASACSHAVRRVTPRPCPPEGISAATLLPLAEPPKPVKLFIPPLPIPIRLRGNHSTIRVVVDTLGQVMPDSVMVCGISDASYSRRMAEAAAGLRFRPAQVAGRSFVAPALLVYDF